MLGEDVRGGCRGPGREKVNGPGVERGLNDEGGSGEDVEEGAFVSSLDI